MSQSIVIRIHFVVIVVVVGIIVVVVAMVYITHYKYISPKKKSKIQKTTAY